MVIAFQTTISMLTMDGTTGSASIAFHSRSMADFREFQYGGYWFSFLDPYPEFWGSTWYETDDVYVDYYNDGYYLYNRRYPARPGIAISISL